VLACNTDLHWMAEACLPRWAFESNQEQPDCHATDHLLLDGALNLGPLISRWEINNFENCCNKSVRILEVLKLLFQQFLNLSSPQRDMSSPILGDLSKNRWSVLIGLTQECRDAH
jgi:hypothetical protein